MRIKIVATPHHKETPYSVMQEMANGSDDHDLSNHIGLVAARAVANVRRAGFDMRDDWTIVLAFRSV